MLPKIYGLIWIFCYGLNLFELNNSYVTDRNLLSSDYQVTYDKNSCFQYAWNNVHRVHKTNFLTLPGVDLEEEWWYYEFTDQAWQLIQYYIQWYNSSVEVGLMTYSSYVNLNPNWAKLRQINGKGTRSTKHGVSKLHSST